jgi:hypothetical protein
MYTQCRSYPLYLDHAWQTVEYNYPGNVSYKIVGMLYTSPTGITEYKYPSDVSYQIVQGILTGITRHTMIYTNTCMLVWLVLLDIHVQRVHASTWFIPLCGFWLTLFTDQQEHYIKLSFMA